MAISKRNDNFLGKKKYKYWLVLLILSGGKTFFALPQTSDAKDWTTKLRKEPEQTINDLFRMHYAYLVQSVFRIIPNANTAEDVVQDVFLELWRKRNTLVFKQSVRAYLRRSAVNKALNVVRDQKIQLSDTPLQPLPNKMPSVTQKMAAGELQEHIDTIIDGLPERCRLIFVLSRFEDMTYQEIADKLGISQKSVENQISKALRLLKEKLNPYL